MADVDIDSLRKSFGAFTAVDGVRLRVEDGELVTLLGPSGSGKTTLLRLVAGHLEPDGGRIAIGGHEVQSLPPERRDIGMVFQSYALFPHRTVFGNVAFGLERRGVGREDISRRVSEALARVRLEELASRKPSELSGGQQQRVALARALVIRPTVLLLDEPLSNLDARLREALRLEIRRIQRELAMTTILVTHDQEEALTLSDRIAVMNAGRIQQTGTPEELYHRPANRFVAEFIGKINLLETERGGALVGVRPEAVRFGDRDGAPEDASRHKARVVGRRFLGELVEISMELGDGTTLVARRPEAETGSALPGADVTVWWTKASTLLVPEG